MDKDKSCPKCNVAKAYIKPNAETTTALVDSGSTDSFIFNGSRVVVDMKPDGRIKMRIVAKGNVAGAK